jgi:hypothetical protein
MMLLRARGPPGLPAGPLKLPLPTAAAGGSCLDRETAACRGGTGQAHPAAERNFAAGV